MISAIEKISNTVDIKETKRFVHLVVAAQDGMRHEFVDYKLEV